MSHFSVLVIGEDAESQLAPYDENTRMPPYKEVVTHDEIVRCLEYNRKEKKINEIVVVEGKVKTPGYPILANLWQGWSGDTLGLASDGTYYKWCTYNPRSKWDWYLLGGRWTGYFRFVSEPRFPRDIICGRPGVTNKDEKVESGRADQLRRCDVDIARMKKEAGDKAEEIAAKVRSALGELTFNGTKTWEQIHKEYENIDLARAAYHQQPVIKALAKADLMPWHGEPVTMFSDLDAFIRCKVAGAVSTFAVVKDGDWFEKGEMGWWGMVANEKDEGEWEQQFGQLFDTIPDDTLIAVYDCHI